MACARVVVRLTARFEANLANIESFLTEAGAAAAFDDLLGLLADSVIPNLERFPRLGRPLLEVPAGSVEAHARITRLRTQWPEAEVREYVVGDYLVLYALSGAALYLLAIRHHRQLSFDLGAHWPPGRGK
jgi:hypothetical protein